MGRVRQSIVAAPGPDGLGVAGALVDTASVLPLGRRCLQASFARAAGPLPGVIVSCTLPPLRAGSGKFGSPWVRMHSAKARARLSTLALLTLCPADDRAAVVVGPEAGDGPAGGPATAAGGQHRGAGEGRNGEADQTEARPSMPCRRRADRPHPLPHAVAGLNPDHDRGSLPGEAAGRRERPQRSHNHTEKPSAAIATNRRIHSTGAAALA